jgi:hypothetical protein
MNSRKMLLLQIYLFLICQVAVVAFTVIVGNGLWGVVQMAAPRLTISDYDYKVVSSGAWPGNLRMTAPLQIPLEQSDHRNG